MKKTYQRFDVKAGNLLKDRLQQDYKRCTGFFVVRESNTLDLQVKLLIDGTVVINDFTHAALMQYKESNSLSEIIYDFSAMNIPAGNASFELYSTGSNETFSAYFVLEND